MTEATFEIKGAEGVIVTVLGPSFDAVTEFTKTAKFHFELAGPVTTEAGELPRAGSDQFPLQDLRDPSNQSLVIEFRLTDPAAVAHPEGTLIGVIDPKVAHKMFNIFKVKDFLNERNTVSVSLSVKTGQVEARLFQNCGRAAAKVWGPPATPEATVAYTGTGKFDFAVFGIDDSSTYGVHGAWSYWYGKTAPSKTSMDITC